LETAPNTITADNLSIISGEYQLQIVETFGLRQIGEQRVETGQLFLVLRGYLYNYSSADREFHDVDFQVSLAGQGDATPDVSLMSVLQAASFPAARYPDCNILRCQDFVLAAKQAQEIILVYVAPATLDHVIIKFTPAGIRPPVELGLLLIPREDSDARINYLALKESVDGQPAYTLQHSLANGDDAEVSEVIDSESMVVDNCFGTGTITRQIAISTNEASQFELTEEIRGSIMGVGPIPFLNGLFELYARRVHNKVEERELTITRTEQVTAAPGTRTGWRLETYKVSFTGMMIFTVGSRVLEVPYQLSNRLRTELTSVPADPCPANAPTATP
jgi:hypothetical protein